VQSRDKVGRATWEAAQPKALAPLHRPLRRGPPAVLDKETGRALGALEAEKLDIAKITGGKISVQPMGSFPKDRWSGGKQLFWNGAKPGDRLELTFEVPAKGTYALSAAFTMARDYGTVRLHLDDSPLGAPIDLYNFPDVITTGALALGARTLDAGGHRLTLELIGANPAASGDMVGLDYLRVTAKE
jgi:hypothetical protein